MQKFCSSLIYIVYPYIFLHFYTASIDVITAVHQMGCNSPSKNQGAILATTRQSLFLKLSYRVVRHHMLPIPFSLAHSLII